MINDTQIKNLKPKNKLYRVTDALGLRIEINPNGSKIWRYVFRWEEKLTMISLGHYPNTSLLKARQLRDEYKQLVKIGIHPKHNNTKAQSTSKQTFKDMFDMWHNNLKDEWSEGYAIDTQQRAAKYLLPVLGDMPITEINAKIMRDLLLDIQDKGVLDTVAKIRGIATRIFSYSVGMGAIEVNPVRDLPLDIFKKPKEKHYATVTEPKKIAWLLNILKEVNSLQSVKIALELAPHLFLRPTELTGLLWSEVDLESRIIRIEARRMKMKKPHIVPMSNQVYEILSSLRDSSLDNNFVFPSPRSRSKPITANSLLVAIRSVGIAKDTFVTHGFRHMASTRLNELGFNADVIETQLAHKQGGVRAVYNQAEYLDDRRIMMQDWSNYLDNLQGNSPLTETSTIDGTIEKLKANIDRLTRR